MSANELTYGDVYNDILHKLRDAGAELLAHDIERTVARGVVLTEQKTEFYKSKSTVFREMDEGESLAVALEFVVTALEPPLMHNKVRATLDGKLVKWMPERPNIESDEITAAIAYPFDLDDVAELRLALEVIVAIARELRIVLPEIA